MAASVVPVPLYHGYAAAVGLKRLLGLSCERHRSYFLMKVIRALERGEITGRLHVTAAGKRDGAGAQAIARISALVFARAFGLTYAHTPFETLAHAELPLPEWLSAWETLLGLGRGEPLAADCPFPRVDLETYASDPRLWKEDRLLVVRHYHTFWSLCPAAGDAVLPVLREKYRAAAGARVPGARLEVCAHVRRGDVRQGDADTGHRFTRNAAVGATLGAVEASLAAAGLPARVRIFSQGVEADFSELRGPGREFCLNTPALDTFRALADADVLLMANSDFSHVAAMLGDGVRLADPRHRVFQRGWIELRPEDGSFDQARLAAELASRWPAGAGSPGS